MFCKHQDLLLKWEEVNFLSFSIGYGSGFRVQGVTELNMKFSTYVTQNFDYCNLVTNKIKIMENINLR